MSLVLILQSLLLKFVKGLFCFFFFWEGGWAALGCRIWGGLASRPSGPCGQGQGWGSCRWRGFRCIVAVHILIITLSF